MRDYNASTLSYVNTAVSQNIFSLFLQTRFHPAAAFIQADVTNLLHTEHCEHNSFWSNYTGHSKKQKMVCAQVLHCAKCFFFFQDLSSKETNTFCVWNIYVLIKQWIPDFKRMYKCLLHIKGQISNALQRAKLFSQQFLRRKEVQLPFFFFIEAKSLTSLARLLFRHKTGSN